MARALDEGTAYGLQRPHHDAILTEVGPGTPGGAFLRRYWHPIGLVGDATATPRIVRVLGEDLVLFRDRAGRPGLLCPRCMHRGTTLYYGKVEAEGIRCCYHGWLFDVEGHCLDQPCEPKGGLRRERARQPWYPLAARYGLLFAYLGPLDRKPPVPRYQLLEDLAPGELLEADDSSLGSGGPAIVPCNWLQHFENVMDPLHVPILHGSFSGAQFTAAMAAMPTVDFETTPQGVKSVQIRRRDDGRTFRRVTEVVMPTLRVVPNPRVAQYGAAESIGWILPIDDTTFRIYVVGRVREAGELGRMRSRFNGKTWFELTEDEHQRFPGDYEAQVGQRAITVRAEEHLVSSDKGVALLRRFLRRQITAVAEGRDPAGITRYDAPIALEAGNYLVDSA